MISAPAHDTKEDMDITQAHITEVLDVVRSSGLTAHATAGAPVSTPVLAVALRHDLNPVELQAAIRRYADAR